MEVIKYRYKDIDIGINTGRHIDRSPIFLMQKHVFPLRHHNIKKN